MLSAAIYCEMLCVAIAVVRSSDTLCGIPTVVTDGTARRIPGNVWSSSCEQPDHAVGALPALPRRWVMDAASG